MPVRSPILGVLEWFRPGEHARVESVLADLRKIGVTHLRTGLSWADYHTAEGRDWYGWLLPRLAREVEVLPCLTYTPPSLALEPRSAAPPKRAADYADFVDAIIERFGADLEWLELWNEPNNLNDWDWRLDPGWRRFCEMVGGAAYWARQRGRRTVLAGMCPTDPNWLRIVGQGGVLAYIDAVGLHGFPGTWDPTGERWEEKVDVVQSVLGEFDTKAAIWITETGFSTWKRDEHQQVRAFVDSLEAPVERLYWYAAQDLAPHLASQEGFHTDERHYGFGLRKTDGSAKLLLRLWEEGLDSVAQVAALPRLSRRSDTPHVLVTGGAGALGMALVERLVSDGHHVRIFDDLSAPGSAARARRLRELGPQVALDVSDVRKLEALEAAVEHADAVFHLAATRENASPLESFETGAQGTLHLLEALRRRGGSLPMVLASPRAPWSGEVALTYGEARVEPCDPELCRRGLDPALHAEPPAPGQRVAEQYVASFAKAHGLTAVVVRIGELVGASDVNWLTQLVSLARSRNPPVLERDRLHVSDPLHVDDAVEALLVGSRLAPLVRGLRFDIGGGPARSVSTQEALEYVESLCGRKLVLPPPGAADAPRFDVVDASAFHQVSGWTPKIGWKAALEDLWNRPPPREHERWKQV